MWAGHGYVGSIVSYPQIKEERDEMYTYLVYNYQWISTRKRSIIMGGLKEVLQHAAVSFVSFTTFFVTLFGIWFILY